MVEELRKDLDKFNTDIRQFIFQNQKVFEETKRKIDYCSKQLIYINRNIQIRNSLIIHSKSVNNMRKQTDNYLNQLSAARMILENRDQYNLPQYIPSTVIGNVPPSN